MAESGDFYFDESAADRVCAFFPEVLVHVKGRHAGQPFELLPWEREVVRELFGWKRKADGLRRYRTAYVEIPRKNGKSTLAAGIGMYMTCADGEYGAEVYSAAADRDQAAIVFDTAKSMVELSTELERRIKPFRRSMVYDATKSSWKVLSSDAPTKHGLNAHAVLFDELHAQPDRELHDVLTTSTAAREQPLVLFLTTAGYDRESICWEVHEYARQVLEGVAEDPSFFARIYGAEEDEDWTDPEVWAKANPSLGITVSRDYLEAECRKALKSPAAQNTFRRLHLNQWTRQRDRWLSLDAWDASAGALMPGEIERAAAGRVAYGGLDLASTTDLAAFVLVIPGDDPEEDPFDVVCRFFAPSEAIHQRTTRDRTMYEAWTQEGWILETEGNVIDYRAIRAEIGALAQTYNIREIAFDRWGSQQIQNDLRDDGLELVQFGQGFASLSGPTKELLHLVLGGRLRHGGHPILRWMADNLVVRSDPAGNVKPDKSKSTEKIDGMVALIMALARACAGEGIEPGSVYENRGLQTL